METHSFFIKMIRVLAVPLLNSIPSRVLIPIIVKSSPYGAKVIERPGTTHSLEHMYTKHENKTKSLPRHIADLFWHNIISQPKAIRNRLKVVEDLLQQEVEELEKSKSSIEIYNLGGGSSRAMINTVGHFSTKSNLAINVTTVDRDEKALELGREFAVKNSVDHLFKWVRGDVRDLELLVSKNSADIIEMVGLLDYFDNINSARIIRKIYETLKPGGLFLVANVFPNSESRFVKNVGWPSMHYKTDGDLRTVLLNSGFLGEEITIFIEPLKVHCIAMARKPISSK